MISATKLVIRRNGVVMNPTAPQKQVQPSGTVKADDADTSPEVVLGLPPGFGVVGIINQGCFCYQNALFQALLSLPWFIDLMRKGGKLEAVFNENCGKMFTDEGMVATVLQERIQHMLECSSGPDGPTSKAVNFESFTTVRFCAALRFRSICMHIFVLNIQSHHSSQPLRLKTQPLWCAKLCLPLTYCVCD